MNYEQLKNSILQEAIEGRLVPQDPNDEPASVLLDRIAAEKAELVKTKKIKKDKNESRIYRTEDGHWIERFSDKKRPEVCIDDEIPFDIPESWEWTRANNIINLLSGRDLQPQYYNSQKEKESIPYITGASSFNNGNLILNRWTKNPVTISHKGDLLITCKGTIGTMAFNVVGDIHIARQVMAISSYQINIKYLHIYLEFKVPELEHKAVSMIPGISREDMLNLLIPIPPLNEQNRIIGKIENIFPKVKEYGAAQDKLDALNAALPEKLKNSILQEAIEGRLVPQNDADEPASVLLDRIHVEKEALIKEKVIKRDKNESRIYRTDDDHWMERFYDKKREEVCIDDEIPFDIPESWEWTRIGYIFDHNTGKALNGGSPGKALTYITTSNLYWNRFELDNLKSMNFKDSEIDKCTIQKGDLLVCEGGDFGRAAIWNFDFDMRIQNHIHRLRSFVKVDTYFFYYIFLLYKRIGLIAGKGIGIQGLSSGALHNILVPVPPMEEQSRIVDKLNKILPRIDNLVKIK